MKVLSLMNNAIGKVQNVEAKTGTNSLTYNKKFFVNQVLEQL